MDILQESKESSKHSFLNHVFDTTEESKAEILNVVQYSVMGVIPVVILNKMIQRFIPEADPENSSLELLAEIFIQLIVMFCGIIVIHRIITYFPTYSGFKYEHLILTNVILAFLVLVLSIQTKIGIKVNILVDRANELWNGADYEERKSNVKRSGGSKGHSPSQADHLDNSFVQPDMFPPAPVVTSKPANNTYDTMMRGTPSSSSGPDIGSYMGPMAANSVLGGAFGSMF